MKNFRLRKAIAFTIYLYILLIELAAMIGVMAIVWLYVPMSIALGISLVAAPLLLIAFCTSIPAVADRMLGWAYRYES